ncbi:MAG: hypothetical protein ABW221_11590 [Vicinamibacteria bacterium]
MRLLATVLLLGLGTRAYAGSEPLWQGRFTSTAAETEAVLELTASCEGCDWAARGREAALLAVALDGRYSSHLVLTRGGAAAPYRVLLGRVAPGEHEVRVTFDRPRSARGIAAAAVASGSVRTFDRSAPGFEGLAHAPVFQARPGSVERFSDVPLAAWYETDTTVRGRRLRYSVVFSNEDGGTPPDRLMATWGRLTDIEYAYGVELAPDGAVQASEFQGPEHKFMPFDGAREAAHPVLHVVTDNNMVDVRGGSAVRFAPVPAAFDLAATSREAVMDAEPWTYRVSAQEARREGRVDAHAVPGSNRLPDPRRFATLEACAPSVDAVIAFEVGVRAGEGVRWHASDGGRAEFRVARNATHFPNGCFRAAVALPPGAAASSLAALRVRAHTRRPREGEAPLPAGAGRARLTSVNRLFLLDAHDEPGADLLKWTGDAPLAVDGAPFEIPIAR